MSAGGVERETESRAVADLLQRGAEGPAALLVEGEAGIGKTTLVLEAVDRATDQGFRVLSSRGSPSEVTYAYAAVTDLLSNVEDSVFDALPPVQRTALNRARLIEEASESSPFDEHVVASAFLSVIENLAATAPVLLTIDDSQWLDAASRSVIGFAARRIAGRTAMLVTARTGDTDSLADASWLEFRRPETLSRVHMRGMTLGGLHSLLAKRLGHTLPRPMITRIHDISGGNPFFAVELAVSTSDSSSPTVTVLPESLVSLVRRRLQHADPQAQSVLLAAACTAAPTIELLAAALDITAERCVELLASAELSEIVELDGNRVRFTHPLYATGVYTDATAAQRRAMHRRFAAVVERLEVRARHLALASAEADPTTLSVLDAAIEATIAKGAPSVAAELMELALKLDSDNAYRRIRAGELHFRAGSLTAARNHLVSVLPVVPSGVLRSLALMWLGAVRGYDDDTPGAAMAMSEAADEAGDAPALRLLCLLRLAMTLVMLDRIGDAVERAAEAVELSAELGVPGLRSQALSIWVVGKFIRGQGVDAQALQEALDLEDPDGGATTWFRASAVQAMMSGYTGNLDRAETEMRALASRMRERGTEVDIIWAAVHLAAIAVWSGRFAEATEAAHEAVERAEQMGGRLVLITAWTAQTAAAAYAGREEEARAAAQAAIDTSHKIGAPQLVKEPTATLGFLEVSLGHHSAALRVMRPLLDDFDPVFGTEIEGGRHLPDAIEALTIEGRVDEAEHVVSALERNGAARDRPWMLAMGARGRAHVLAARGELEGARAAIVEAMTHHERVPMPFERARSQLLLGQLERRRRSKSASAATLNEALATFERLGAPLWAARARAELARVNTGRGDERNLTPTEGRVAELAANGLSNKQIAAELFIAAKTVEMNLSNIYRKLGIRSRGGLSGALASMNAGHDR